MFYNIFMKLLLHICCANCALYPVKTLQSRGVKLYGLWYNPNIHPYTEYRMRLDALRQLQELWKLDIEYKDHYGLKEFIQRVVYDEKNRCQYCYMMRLEETASKAKEMGLDGFSTTLLVSPYQKFDKIIETATILQDRYDIEFVQEDFRPGWKEGVDISRELGLYRQKYCGCIYSEMERYCKKDSKG